MSELYIYDLRTWRANNGTHTQTSFTLGSSGGNRVPMHEAREHFHGRIFYGQSTLLHIIIDTNGELHASYSASSM